MLILYAFHTNIRSYVNIPVFFFPFTITRTLLLWHHTTQHKQKARNTCAVHPGCFCSTSWARQSKQHSTIKTQMYSERETLGNRLQCKSAVFEPCCHGQGGICFSQGSCCPPSDVWSISMMFTKLSPAFLSHIEARKKNGIHVCVSWSVHCSGWSVWSNKALIYSWMFCCIT